MKLNDLLVRSALEGDQEAFEIVTELVGMICIVDLDSDQVDRIKSVMDRNNGLLDS